MTGIELLVGGMLLYGLAFLALGAVRRPSAGPTEQPDRHDAPIFVRRGRSQGSTATMATRTGGEAPH